MTVLSDTCSLPELRLLETRKSVGGSTEFFVEKTSVMKVCPRCATPSTSTYDRRWVRIQDDPLRSGEAFLWVHKRRFYSKPCRRPFTEPVDGVRKGYRTTMRYRNRLLWACEHFSDLKDVRSVYRCSSGLLHRVLYEQLELKRRTRLYDWPTKVGIDEHLFKHDSRLNTRRFVTMVVDHKNGRLVEVVEGKEGAVLKAGHVPMRCGPVAVYVLSSNATQMPCPFSGPCLPVRSDRVSGVRDRPFRASRCWDRSAHCPAT